MRISTYEGTPTTFNESLCVYLYTPFERVEELRKVKHLARLISNDLETTDGCKRMF
jgi:hypothetical protein